MLFHPFNLILALEWNGHRALLIALPERQKCAQMLPVTYVAAVAYVYNFVERSSFNLCIAHKFVTNFLILRNDMPLPPDKTNASCTVEVNVDANPPTKRKRKRKRLSRKRRRKQRDEVPTKRNKVSGSGGNPNVG